MKKRVVVGMSGGVDSSIAAALLKEQGYEVVGLFMRNWHEEGDDGICTAETDFQDVKNVCAKLDIPYFSVDFSKEYMDRVFKLFLAEYEKGRTPNPDVLCNKEIKFDAFLEHAKKAGADLVATGHYCDIAMRDGKLWLTESADTEKDQTYFLNQLKAEQLRDVVFPLGSLKKTQVRELAKKYDLPTADKKDSTGICFIGERNFRKFLSEYIPMKEGEIKTLDGKVVGRHSGVYYYTIGQRKGLGVGGGYGDTGEPWFVVKKDITTNTLYVTEGETGLLFAKSLTTDRFNFITDCDLEKLPGYADEGWQNIAFDCSVRIRHRQPKQKAKAIYNKNTGIMKLNFETPQRAVAEGQYAVVYDGKYCLGGGVIEDKEI